MAAGRFARSNAESISASDPGTKYAPPNPWITRPVIRIADGALGSRQRHVHNGAVKKGDHRHDDRHCHHPARRARRRAASSTSLPTTRRTAPSRSATKSTAPSEFRAPCRQHALAPQVVAQGRIVREERFRPYRPPPPPPPRRPPPPPPRMIFTVLVLVMTDNLSPNPPRMQ